MTIYTVKQELFNHIGDIVNIKCSLGRNKYEEYKATIKEIYNCIFLVECETGYTKSFTYTDILTKVIKIDY